MADVDTLSERLARELAQGKLDTEREPSAPSIPTPNADPKSLLAALNKMRQVIEMREARSGSVMDKHLTLRDMVNAGLVTLNIGNQNLVGNIAGSVVGGVGDVTLDIGGGSTPGSGYVDPRPDYATPPTITGLTVTGAFTSIILTWDIAPINFINFAYVEVWRNTTDNLGSAVLVGTSTSTLYSDESGSIGVTYYYWVRSINSEAAPGAFNAVSGVSGGRLLVGNVDLGPLVVEAANLASGAVTASKLATAAVEATKFAAGIEPVGIVSGVPGSSTGQTTIYDAVTAKVYRWNGSAYVASVPAVDVTGTLTDAQIADLAAAKLTGQIIGTQITDGAISTPKIAAGAVVTASLAASAVTANEIAAGAVTTAKLNAGAVTANELAADSVVAGKVAAGAINTAQLVAGAVTADRLLVTGIGASLCQDPNTRDESAWDLTDSSLGVLAGSPTGYAIGASVMGAQVASILIPIDETKNYDIRASIVQASGSATARLRVTFYDEAGAALSAAVGWPASGSFDNYLTATAFTPSGSWTEYRLGFGPDETAQISAGARYCRVGARLNISGASQQYVTGFRLTEKAGADLIVDGSIIASKIAANAIAVGTAAIQNGAIVNAMIANLAVDAAKIADASIATAKISDLAVTNAKISDLAVTNAKINDLAVTNAKIADMSVAKLTAGSVAVGELLQSTGFSTGVTGWQIHGNGNAEFGSASIRGQLVASQINSNGLDIKNSSGDVILSASGTGALDWRALTNSPGPNLIPSPELDPVNNGDPTAPGWTKSVAGTPLIESVLKPSTSPSYGAPWNKNAPFFYAKVDQMSEYVRWYTTNTIAIDENTDYTLACWAREYTAGEARVYFGMICYDNTGANIGNVYGQLALSRLTTTWTRYADVFGPSGTAFPVGTASVRPVWYGAYNTGATTYSGSTFATRFTFNEGARATNSYAPFDPTTLSSINQITAANVSTYIASAAIGTAQIGTLNASVITAGTITTDRIQIGAVSTTPARTTTGTVSLYSGAAVSTAGPVTINGPIVTTVGSGRVFGSVTGSVFHRLDTTSARRVGCSFKLQLVRTSDSAVMDESGQMYADMVAVASTSLFTPTLASGSLFFDAVAAGTYRVRLWLFLTNTDNAGVFNSNLVEATFSGELCAMDLRV